MFDVVIVWINAVLAGIACVALVIAAGRSFPELRPVYAGSAVLAFIYTCSYSWLAFHIERAPGWSSFIRPFGSLLWTVVITWPAVKSTRLWRKVQDAAVRPDT